MATVAEFTIEADGFPLGRLFEAFPGIELELERILPTNRAILPYLWIKGADMEDLETTLGGLPELEDVEVVDEVDREHLVRLTWKREHEGVLKAITETDVTFLSGAGSENKWTFEVRGDDRAAVAEFQQYCRDHGVPITLTALHSLSEMQTGAAYNLTDSQREALELAYERGYFQTPRAASLEEIAEELGITGQSLGSRIRRGTRRLIGSTLIGA